MGKHNKHYRVTIIGAGPAGTGPLVFASNQGRLDEFLRMGVAVIEKGKKVGGGVLGKYVINSNSLGGAFLECLEGEEQGALSDAINSPEAKRLRKFVNSPAPLGHVGSFLDRVGECLKAAVDKSEESDIFLLTEALSIDINKDGTCTVLTRNETGKRKTVISDKVIMAIGGRQKIEDILSMSITNNCKVGEVPEKILLTDFLLTDEGMNVLADKLEKVSRPKVLIVGGSHSAFSIAWILLRKLPAIGRAIEFRDGDICILHKHDIKLQYNSAEEARKEGYSFSEEADVCSITGKVNRFGGLYGDARETYKQVVGLGVDKRESKIKLLEITDNDDQLVRNLIEDVDIVVPAFGYTTNMLPIRDAKGKEIALMFDSQGLVVDEKSRVVKSDGIAMDNILAMGIGSGMKLSKDLGGEAHFKGRLDGVWLYQHPIGETVFNEIMSGKKT